MGVHIELKIHMVNPDPISSKLVNQIYHKDEILNVKMDCLNPHLSFVTMKNGEKILVRNTYEELKGILITEKKP